MMIPRYDVLKPPTEVTPILSILYAKDGPLTFCTSSQPSPSPSALTKSLQAKPSPGESFHWEVLLFNTAELRFSPGMLQVSRDQRTTSLYFPILLKC